MIKTYSIRIYPTKEQEEKIINHINACRFVWNKLIEIEETNREDGNKFLREFDLKRLIPEIKRDNEWLKEISSSSMQIVCSEVVKAYIRFFDKIANHPKFKRKKERNKSYPLCENRFYFEEKVVQIQMLGRVKYKTNYELKLNEKNFYKNPRIVRKGDKWLLNVGVEFEKQELKLSTERMGIDLGVKELATVAFGNEKIIIKNINKTAKMKKLEKQAKHIQKSISRKYEANKQGKKYIKTNNIIKLEKQYRNKMQKMENIRKNHLHQASRRLVNMLPCVITMENLNIRGMLKNKYLSKSISEARLYEFKRQIEYKSQLLGIQFQEADRLFASTKICSKCGNKKSEMNLKERTYHCEKCGYTEDRDYNAAINLKKYMS